MDGCSDGHPFTGPLCKEQHGPFSCQRGNCDVCQAEVASPFLTILRGLQVSEQYMHNTVEKAHISILSHMSEASHNSFEVCILKVNAFLSVTTDSSFSV